MRLRSSAGSRQRAFAFGRGGGEVELVRATRRPLLVGGLAPRSGAARRPRAARRAP